MAVSVTSTVNLVFGSLVLDPVTGVILNDEVCGFRTRIVFSITNYLLDG
jgi:gamma-glutamyltranspeptidase / glutathione hydrolase / leukotriene-C4 hydrolase